MNISDIEYQLYQEGKLSKSDRDKLSKSDFGIPELEKYPLIDKKHVLQAVRFFNKAESKYKLQLAKRIIRKANEYDMDHSKWDTIHDYIKKHDEHTVQESYKSDLHNKQKEESRKQSVSDMNTIKNIVRQCFNKNKLYMEYPDNLFWNDPKYKKFKGKEKEYEMAFNYVKPLYDKIINEKGDRLAFKELCKVCGLSGSDNRVMIIKKDIYDKSSSYKDVYCTIDNDREINRFKRTKTTRFIHFTSNKIDDGYLNPRLHSGEYNNYANNVFLHDSTRCYFWAIDTDTVKPNDIFEMMSIYGHKMYEYIPKENDIFIKDTVERAIKTSTPVFIKTNKSLPVKNVADEIKQIATNNKSIYNESIKNKINNNTAVKTTIDRFLHSYINDAKEEIDSYYKGKIRMKEDALKRQDVKRINMVLDMINNYEETIDMHIDKAKEKISKYLPDAKNSDLKPLFDISKEYKKKFKIMEKELKIALNKHTVQESFQDADYELPPGIDLRPADEKDLPMVLEWTLQTINSEYRTKQKIIDKINKENKENIDTIKIITDGNKDIGMYQAYPIDEDEWWYLAEIYLIPDYRGKGIGSTLIKKDINSHDKLVLRVDPDNVRAIELYESLGFVVTEKEENSWIMRLDKTIQESYNDDGKDRSVAIVYKRWSTLQQAQYKGISDMWNIVEKYSDINNLEGYGTDWDDNNHDFLYGIIFKDKNIPDKTISELKDVFPDIENSFNYKIPSKYDESYSCNTNDVASTYNKIWSKGPLLYELEEYSDNDIITINVVYKDITKITNPCISYAMGVDESIMELKNKGFEIIPDNGDYKVIFDSSCYYLWEEYINEHLKDTYWNEYINLTTKEICFMINENNHITKIINNGFDENFELLTICNRLCDGNFKSIKDLILSNDFYRDNISE